MSAYCCVITVVALCYYYISMCYARISVGNLCTCRPSAYWQYSFYCHYSYNGDRGSTVVKVLCYKSEGRWYDPSLVSLEFFIDIKSFRSHCGSGVDSASNRYEFQEHFLGVKAAGV